MREARLTVVVSQGQSRSPDKRQLESELADGAAQLAGVDVLVVPHLYDLARDGETYQQLRQISGDIVVCAWLFDRATHWVLDRHGVRGQVGHTLLKADDDSADDAAADAAAAGDSADDSAEAKRVGESAEGAAGESAEATTVTASQPRPQRHITCLDLRARPSAGQFVDEIARIAAECRARTWLGGQAKLATLDSFLRPTNDTYIDQSRISSTTPVSTLLGSAGVVTIAEHPTRRWYPVIDFSRCTNCMECIDFCLFGVYGIDKVETILVEQPDNCRKGCPACSRVCPQNAIIFPQHKTPAIAGAPMDAGGFKIDLSKLFGAPDDGADALEVAARERDEQLLLAGRQAVGVTEELTARLAKTAQPRDHLDNLLDQLDSLEL